MQLDFERRAIIELHADFVREILNPRIWGEIMSEVFIYEASYDHNAEAYYYKAVSKNFDKVADGKTLPVWRPEWIKVPGLFGVLRQTILWRRKDDPHARALPQEQSPSYKKIDFTEGRNVKI